MLKKDVQGFTKYVVIFACLFSILGTLIYTIPRIATRYNVEYLEAFPDIFGLIFDIESFDVNDPRLRWAPPEGWQDYRVISYEEYNSQYKWNCSFTENLIIDLPDNKSIEGPINLKGGGNIVIIGGEVLIPRQSSDARERDRVGFSVSERDCGFDNPRTIHIEGVSIGLPDINDTCYPNNKVTNCSDLTEGFHLATQRSTLQIQNVRVNNIHARDEVGFTDAHPDIIQAWGGVVELRVDKLTGSTGYQAFMLKNDFPVGDYSHGEMYFSRVNINSNPTAKYLFWENQNTNSGNIYFEDVYLQPAPGRNPNKVLWPEWVFDIDSNNKVSFDSSFSPKLSGDLFVEQAVQDFVPIGVAGYDYVSPGYQSDGGSVVIPTVAPTNPVTPTPTEVVYVEDSQIILEAESGALSNRYLIDSGYIYTSTENFIPSNGEEAVYEFEIESPGFYQIAAFVNANSEGSNSVFVNVDSQPSSDSYMVWDITPTSGFEMRNLSWRGNGTPDINEFSPKVFDLQEGQHSLIIKSREANTLIDYFVVSEIAQEITPTPTPTTISSGSSSSSGGSSSGGSSGGGSGSSSVNIFSSDEIDLALPSDNSTVQNCIDKYQTENPTVDTFEDVSDSVFLDNIVRLRCRDVVNGFGDGTYRPNENVSRYAMAKFIARSFLIETSEKSNVFPDLSTDDQFNVFITALNKHNIARGYSDGEFKGDREITRGEAIAFVVRAMEHKGTDITPQHGISNFRDLDVNNTFYKEVKFVEDFRLNSGERIINGYSDGEIKLENKVTRGEMSKIVDLATLEIE